MLILSGLPPVQGTLRGQSSFYCYQGMQDMPWKTNTGRGISYRNEAEADIEFVTIGDRIGI